MQTILHNSRATVIGGMLLMIAMLAAGCAVPQTPVSQLDNAVAAAAVSYAGSELARVESRFPLTPQPTGTPQEIAEFYLRRFQPGPEPRVFQNTLVYDRQGRLLADLFDEGRRTWMPIDRIADFVRYAAIATEDGTFYRNGGIDERRLVGVIAQGLAEGDLSGGASTITMQLVRNLFLPPDERFGRNIDRKVIEVLLARELTEIFSKDEILEMYLNLAYFGHLAYGPEAAAQTYFGKPASDLSLAEASLMMGLVQRPAGLDPFLNPEGAKNRQRIVLDLMVRRGYITQAEADAAHAEPLQLAADPNVRNALAPHFLQFLRDYLAQAPRNIDIMRAGLRIQSTIDLDLQEYAQQIVRDQVDRLRAAFNLNNAALVALKPGTAEVMAMVGSIDYANEAIGGQVNVILSKRQPGSTIKPVVYATALDSNSISPATLLWDVKVEYPIDEDKKYVPQNYDLKLRGPVTVRTALGNSLNVPTIQLFDTLDPELFLATANRMGVDFTAEGLKRSGLSAGLGALEVTPLELTTAYHTLANDGRFVEATPVLSVTDGLGRPIALAPTRPAQQAVSPDTAFLVTDILSDNEARAMIFGESSRLKLSRPAAAKTGTTTDFRDNWTVGFTKYLVTGVWSGNNDGEPMRGVDGITGAGPIWNQFMDGIIADPRLRTIIGAPEDEAAWAFAPTPGVTQVAANCPPPLFCPTDGEYFTVDWMETMAGFGGPYGDSFAAGDMAGVNVVRGNDVRETVGLCVQTYTAAGQTALAMPLGAGRLAMRSEAPVDDGDPASGQTSESEPAVQNALRGIPVGLPLSQITRQNVNTAAGLDPTTLIVYRERSERLTEQQDEAYNWAVRNGQWLMLGPCSEMETLMRAMYPDLRRVELFTPPPPPPFITEEPDEASTGLFQVNSASQGSVGAIVNPAAGEVVSGVIALVGVASHPEFVKWQLDLMLYGTQETFLSVGEWAAPQPAQLFAWDTALYPNGNHTLRLRVVRRDFNYDEYYSPVTIAN